ncbi:MAG: choice-of-anchor J domain-containing protein [Proteobacteria bacterium]|nr:choice-of-anchor J domain-containing protein [Pseudomonadota bacterium]
MKKQLLILSGVFTSNIVLAQLAPTEQGFDDIENIPGWVTSNQSDPIGETNWLQGSGVTSVMIAQDGDANSFIAANYRNTAGTSETNATICNYLIMPDLGNLESVSFYTRSRIAANNFNVYPDRLFVVYSPTGEIDTGNCTEDFGDFTETLMVINPDLTQESTSPEGYPLQTWEQFSVEVNGTGRVAFVYYVEDAGFFGPNSNYIGIDSVQWVLAPLFQTKPLIIQGKLPKK